MSATTMQAFAAGNRNGLIVSLVGHVVLFVLLLLTAGIDLIPRQPMTRLAIEAVIIDEGAMRRAAEAEKLKTEQAAQRQREETARQERIVKEQQAAEQRQQQEAKAASERQRVEQQRKDAEAKATAEKQRKLKEQQAAEAKAKEEKARAEAKAKEEKARAEAKAKAEKERAEAAARAKAEAERKEQARRQAELVSAMAAEEELLAARQSGELARYLALIQQKVERNWVPPATVQAGLECEVAVKQLPNGDVTEARTVRCNGDETVRRSVEHAVMRSSPLPLPDNQALFERNLRFVFKPQQ